MKKLIIILLTCSMKALTGQIILTPAMINNAGGSSVVGATYYDYTVGEPITLFGGTPCDSIFSGFQHCAIDTLRIKHFNATVGGSGNTTICQTSSVTLSAQAGSTYTWSNGMHTQTLSVGNTGIYTATVTNGCGDVVSSNPITITVLTPPVPSICEVTTDSAGLYNEIYWEKSLYPRADSFIVYREVTGGFYTRIGAIDKNALCMYVDTNRSIGPANGDPNVTQYKYKLATKDSCNNVSSQSLWHQTIHTHDNKDNSFNFTLYAIEGTTATPVGNYYLWRKDLTSGLSQTVSVTASGTSLLDANYATYSPLNYTWYVDAVGFNCDPALRAANANGVQIQKVKTKSNHANDRLATKLDELNLVNTQVKIYPNPAKEKVTVELDAIKENMSIGLTDVLGQTLLSINAPEKTNTIQTSNFVNGIYFIIIKSNGKTIAVKKVILE